MSASWGLAAGFAAGLIAYGLNRAFLRRPALLAADAPTERSLHRGVKLRGGGLGIAGALLAVGLGAYAGGVVPVPPGVVGPLLVIAAVSYCDDHVSLSPLLRLPAHLLAAGWLVAYAGAVRTVDLPGLALPVPGWLAIGATVLLLVWLTNLYNFMDGMDGFAAGMAVFGFGALAVIGLLRGEWLFFAASCAVAGAAGGFLALNFPPARLFMGDVGASTLGFIAGAMLLWAQRQGLFPLWVGCLVFAPFLVDATATLGRRTVRRERIWQAHRSHYYQRLVGLGWSHRRAVLHEYAVMLGCALSGVAAVLSGAAVQWAIIGIWAVVFLGLMSLVSRLEQRR